MTGDGRAAASIAAALRQRRVRHVEGAISVTSEEGAISVTSEEGAISVTSEEGGYE
jgi:hypothetical protein